eukprot:394489-Ditylum_brightwellii.AAC.1
MVLKAFLDKCKIQSHTHRLLLKSASVGGVGARVTYLRRCYLDISFGCFERIGRIWRWGDMGDAVTNHRRCTADTARLMVMCWDMCTPRVGASRTKTRTQIRAAEADDV